MEGVPKRHILFFCFIKPSEESGIVVGIRHRQPHLEEKNESIPFVIHLAYTIFAINIENDDY
jgi:hypothetical protein